ncbi:hypothetical protein ACWDG1_50255 [Streptomyces sp. NPDC001177]
MPPHDVRLARASSCTPLFDLAAFAAVRDDQAGAPVTAAAPETTF